MVNLTPESPAESGIIPFQSQAPAAPSNAKRWNIGRDKLEVACTAIPRSQADLLTWLWQYCAQRDLGRDRVAQLLRKEDGEAYSYDSIYQVLTGRRKDVNLAPFCAAIAQFRQGVESAAPASGFIETALFRQIHLYCERARRARRIGFIWGDMNIGKSASAAELARRDPGVISLRLPTRAHLGHVLQEFAKKLAMGGRSTLLDLRDRVIDGLPADGLLIVDEADQCFASIKHSLGFATLDFLREIYDRRNIGIVLMMDHAGRDQFIGAAPAKRLNRIWSRRLPPLQLPTVPCAEDLDLFAASRGLPPANDETIRVQFAGKSHADQPLRLQNEVIAKSGLGLWLAVLDEAVEQARAAGRAVTWGAVIKADAEFAAHQA